MGGENFRLPLSLFFLFLFLYLLHRLDVFQRHLVVVVMEEEVVLTRKKPGGNGKKDTLISTYHTLIRLLVLIDLNF